MNLFKRNNHMNNLLILTILLLGTFLRFYKLSTIPAGLYVDEAISGYNAYSIFLTGKDEYGKILPLAFRFFGSYSPPLYVYLTTVPIKFFGLSIFSTRFISAMSGSISIIIFYFLLKNLKVCKFKYGVVIGTLLFSILPWSVFYSRAGYEIYLGFTLFLLGTLFLWKSLIKPENLFYGLIFLSLSIYGAHTERYLVPIFISLFLMVYRKIFFARKYRKILLVSIITIFLIQIPNIYLFFTPAFGTKGGLFYKDVINNQSLKLFPYLLKPVGTILSFLREFLSQYLNYFSPKSLFYLPDQDIQRSAPELAPFYFWMIIPYFVGLYVLVRKRISNTFKFIILMFIVFPLPVSLTPDPFSSQRVIPLMIPLMLVICIGVDTLFVKWGKSIFILLFILIGFSALSLWRSYFVLLPKERARAWSYGYNKLAEELVKRPDTHFVIDQSRLKPVYIELAFFLNFSPIELQESVDQNIKNNYYKNVNFSSEYSFSNIETRNIVWEKDIYKKQILIGDEFAISDQQAEEHFLDKVFEIKDPVGFTVFIGYETNPDKKCTHTYYKSLYCINK